MFWGRARISGILGLVALLVACEFVAGIEDRRATPPIRDTDPIGGGDAGADGGRTPGNPSPDGGEAGATGTGGAGGTGGDAGAVETCEVDDKFATTATNTSFVTRAAFGGDKWGLTWRDGSGHIFYNALDAAGELQHQADVELYAAGANEILSLPRIAPLGDRFLVGFGRGPQVGPGATDVQLLVVDPSDPDNPLSATGDGIAMGDLGVMDGIAVGEDDSVPVILTVGRQNTVGATPAIVHHFTDAPMHVTSVEALPEAYSTAITWSAALETFAVAAVRKSATEPRLELITYPPDELIGTAVDIGIGGDAPVIEGTTFRVGIAAADARFAIVWPDNRHDNNEIYLTTVDENGDRPQGRTDSVLVSDAEDDDAEISPEVAFDGEHIVVAWLNDGSQKQVYLRRFDTNLNAVGEPLCVSCKVPHIELDNIALVAIGEGDYGVTATRRSTEEVPSLLFRVRCGE